MEIEKAISRFVSSNSVPGIAAAVVLNGEPAWSAGFGMADIENSVPVTSTTLFRLASISKTITAVAILQLSESGQLNLDAPVQRYCQGFPEKGWPITTRALLGHLAGIRHYNPDRKGDIAMDSARHFSTMEESLQIFADDPLVAKPGSKFNYSTYGYTLLGCVLEGAASRKYVDYVKENVFRPSGMQQTQADDSFAIIPHRARWYAKDKSGSLRQAGVLDSSYKIPGGGLLSSVDDMAHFEAALLNGKLLRPASRNLMWTEQRTADGKPTGYGLGWDIEERSNLHIVGHPGDQQGTSTSIQLVPERNIGVVVLTNIENVDASALSSEILNVVLNLKNTIQ